MPVKKLLCLILALMLVALSATVAVSAASDGEDVLVVTVNGANPMRIDVGNEFIVRVGLYAGSSKIINGQCRVSYDSDYLSYVPVMGVREDEESYCFPGSICNSGIVMNSALNGTILYNFSRITGVAAFDDADKLFARFRFKAEAPGTVDITHLIEYMKDLGDHKIYYGCAPDPAIAPYTATTIEPSLGCVGDIDGDYSVTLLDATMMQRIAAGERIALDLGFSDVTGDGAVTLRDAMVIRRYLAGDMTLAEVGKHLYRSEE